MAFGRVAWLGANLSLSELLGSSSNTFSFAFHASFCQILKLVLHRVTVSHRYELRIDAMIFKDEFATNRDALKPQIDVLQKTIDGKLHLSMNYHSLQE